MTVEVASSDQLLEFIFNISKSFQELPSSSKNVFDSPENESLCQNFLKSTSAGTIYVIKLKHENNDSFQVTEDLKDLEGCLSIIALIKSNEPISSIKSFDSQLHILNIPVDRTTKTLTSETNIEGNESESNSSRKFESIRSLINLGVSPYFDLITSKEQNDSISVVRKKFNELSLTLQHLQQKIHIPDLISSTHPVIVEYLLASASATSDEIVDSIPLTTLQDTSFLNQLTTIVNGWVKQIQAITKLNHSPLDGKSVIEEILFWKSMDESLNSLNQQISQREIQTTIEILKRAKRYHITISFNNETGLEDKIIETQNYSSILKDFPIDELLSSDITTLKRSVNIIFNHLKKLKNLASYPLLRSIELIEVVLNDITTKFIDIVSSSVYLMSLPMDQFLDYYNQNLNGIFEAIDMDIKSMINLIRELLRKRQEKFMIIKINQDNLNSWKSSLENLKDFRLGHTNLIKTCEILGKSDEKLIEAYNQYIIPINVCDMTTGGINVWKSNESLYMNVFEDVKKVVIIEINELFDTCNNFNEFLNLFKRFRGREDQELEHEGRHFVLSFISEEHKLRCMNIVEEEIQAIHIKNRKHSNIIINSLQPFTGYYNDDIVGKIIWLMSIHKSAKFYLSNLNQLFGDNWDQYSTGNKINNELKSLLKIGNPEEIAAQWMESIQFDLELLGPILSVRVSEEDDDTTDYLHVNFDSTNIQLIDQLKQLSNLGFRIPTSIASKLHVIDKIYPFVKDLTDSVNILNDILNRELTSQTLYGVRYAFLVTSQKSLVFELVEECSKVTWTILAQAFDLQKGVEQQNVQDLSNLIESKSLLSLKSLLEQVYVLYGKVNSIREFVVSFEGQLNDLEIDCPYQQSDITRRLLEISDLVTRTCYEDFDKIDLLYELVNIEIEEVLQRKCERELDTFQKSIRSQNLFAEKKLTISLSFQDQIFSFNPDINSYKKTWFDKINDIISTVSNNYLINCENEKKFTSIFEKISLEVLKCYIEIDDIISEANEYLAKWETLQFQWETSTQELEKQFGNKSNNESLLLWIKKTQEIRKCRAIFDTAASTKEIGLILTIDYSSTQLRVFSKFEAWQHNFLVYFSEKLNQSMREIDFDLIRAIQILEQSFDFSSTSKMLQFILNTNNFMQDLESLWKQLLSIFEDGQKVLTILRFKFPQDWLYAEQLENHLSEIATLITRKSATISDHLELIQPRLTLEAKRIDEAIQNLNQSWQIKKPISGDLLPNVAIETLHKFEDSCAKLELERNSLLRASQFIDLHIVLDEYVNDTIEEVKDLLSVWLSLDGLWEGISSLRTTKWDSISSTRSLRLKLDELLAIARSLPTKTRQYSAFNTVQDIIKSHIRNHSMLTELKGNAMKARHWKILSKSLSLRGGELSIETLTIGQVWDMNLSVNEQLIRSVLNQAQMELTLEENLSSIRNTWGTITFEMFNYQNNRCRLIKNWDKLFDQCNSDLSSLLNMKNSAFYFNFEQEAVELEGKLTRFFHLMDTWVDVQREWVYLDGVFVGGNEKNNSNNSDIANLLPLEYSRFNNLSHEFFAILRKANKFPLAIEVLSIQEIQKVMERTFESLKKVRRSLSDYLEKQRELFPRFYFIGNEDLLQIIGSGNNTSDVTSTINLHIKKMFSGIMRIAYSPESSCISGIYGDLDEYIPLISPVSLIKFPKLNEWLLKLETEIRLTLSNITGRAIKILDSNLTVNFEGGFSKQLILFLDEFPSQVITLAFQVLFTKLTDRAIIDGEFLYVLHMINEVLNLLTTRIILDLTLLQRKKYESLIIEILHMRDIINSLIEANGHQNTINCIWNTQQAFYFEESQQDPLNRLKVKQADVDFVYGFEYLGIPEKLAYTPLTNRCFLALTQALGQKLGGSPFGPAGTGKTESVKALGNNLGKMVLIFCCDESFDFQSIGRIFLGICKVGCWGCFDEFNRLDEKILSAVSSQIESIETGLRSNNREIELSDKKLTVHEETGIFITMNPGYAGRSELPENLKKLFRSVSMDSPDMDIIIEVLLTSSGFSMAKELATIIVPLFSEILEKSSKQVHYDFGLRALKSTLLRCGSIKRKIQHRQDSNSNDFHSESKIVYRSIKETISPKLILEDEFIMNSLLDKYFPGISYTNDDFKLIDILEKNAENQGLSARESWIEKVLQFYRIQNTNHGIMLVGNAGSGKTTIWRLLLESITELSRIENLTYVIDCKVMLKDKLYGSLDVITREWVDGLFTSILRKVTSNLRGEMAKRIWIVFDGDIDPEWAENLNSVLDDNKILTLPNGERIRLPENIRLIFEADSLKSTTPATVSRCGMVWLDESLITLDELEKKLIFNFIKSDLKKEDFGAIIKELLTTENLASIIMESKKFKHIMKFNIHRYLETLFTLLSTYYKRYEASLCEDSNEVIYLRAYVTKSLILSLIWAFTGDCSLDERVTFGEFIIQLDCFSDVDRVEVGSSYIDFKVSASSDVNWISWLGDVQDINLEPHQVSDSNTVIPTLDTVRHENLIYAMLNEHRPFLLCGPPGSGKTMILLEALRKSQDMDILTLNFSKDTTPELLMKSLLQFCEYKNTNGSGLTLSPKINGKWVVVFCDEINLPGYDKYGTQTVISLLRQMIEQGGFWRLSDQQWVTLSNVQFVGACNPPTDAGRNPLSERFLRHASLIMVDYPGKVSLKQIYQTYNMAVMKCAPNLRGFTQSITEAMLEIYFKSKQRLTIELQSHYIYSPRELTRWSKGLLEAMKSHQYESLDELVRLWYHEGLRLFYDRLVNEEEKVWTLNLFQETILKVFPHLETESITTEPVLFSNWLSLDYEYISSKGELVSFVTERLRVFSEEEIDVDLILYDEMLDHALRIDRVLRQPQGHLILVGPSTSGKSTLSRFVAWLNGQKVVQLNVFSGYTLSDFDSTLRSILLRCVSGERICFMIDESSVLETSFIERMNTLLANAEIPGLFEDENLHSLMKLCQVELQTQGLYLDTDDELYRWFTSQVAQNLHVIFTISDTTISNSTSTTSANRPKITTSPALFNRCVLSWMGDWSDRSLFSMASSLVVNVPLDLSNYVIPISFESIINNPTNEIVDIRGVVVDSLVYIHRSIGRNSLPSLFLQLVKMFIKLFGEKLFNLEENQRHINNGLDKLKETVLQVNELKVELSEKSKILTQKDNDAKVMLNKMLTDQNEAERKQEFSIETQEELNKQQIEIERRRSNVMKDLEMAEPAVLEARKGVQNIKKQHLTEIRSMANPPNGVKITMESVCILLGYDVQSWRDVQLVVRRDDFITNIVSFDNEEQLTTELRQYMVDTYLSRSDYNFEAANRASKACGPLLQWVEAQLTYSSILERIGPLRKEMLILEESTQKTKAQLIAIDQMIKELEESIESYKDDYSQLIRDAENVKSDMKTVTNKVNRSLKLIESLTNERERWQMSIKKFGIERELLVGDSILAAAFSTYCGAYDERSREGLVNNWKVRLNDCAIKYDNLLNFSQYLSNGKEVLELQNKGGDNGTLDNLNIENFSLMKSSSIPFIIDPPNNVIESLDDLVSKISKKKLIITSFLNSNFIQQLENALRFGGIILIQDSEYYDPILNSVLRRETYKNGGRTVVKLRDQEIDYSPDFKLFLHTRDPLVDVSQFVLGRTSIINFTVTSTSLENQILNITLSNKRPDIEEKRKGLLLAQGEYKVRLHTLEEELLSSLGNDDGKTFKNILEDDAVLETLETLKDESNQIDIKMEESIKVMQVVDEVRNKFYDVAKHSSLIFTIIKSMNELNRFYEFSLFSFTEIFKFVLAESGSSNELVVELYKETFARISFSLKKKDKIIFALCLLLAYKSLEDGERYVKCFDLIMKAISEGASNEKLKLFLYEIYKLNLIEESSNTMSVESILEENPSNATLESLSGFLRCFSSHQDGGSFNSFSSAFANSTSLLFTGPGNYSSNYDFANLVKISSTSTILLVTPDDFDPTFKVQQLAISSSISLSTIAMGSKEGIELSNKEILSAMTNGSWVIIQNVHLSPAWLNQLESKFHSATHKDFKLFLTCSGTSKTVPSTLINKSLVFMFDNQLEFKDHMLELCESIPSDVILSNPSERKHLYFLLVWFHCVILERLKYVPISFSSRYDFSISDFKSSCYVLENILQQFGSTRTNVSPDNIPWETLRYMIANITYGGKIDNEKDLQFILELAEKLFKPGSFDLDFNLIDNQFTKADGHSVHPPEGGVSSTSLDVYKNWITTSLPERVPLNWIDLDETVDKLVREEESKYIATTVYDISLNNLK